MMSPLSGNGKATIRRVTSLQRTLIEDVLALSKDEQYQDVTIICQKGTIQSNSVLLAAIFPMFREVLASFNESDSDLVISLPDTEVTELEAFFTRLYQKSSSITDNKPIQLLRPTQIENIGLITFDKKLSEEEEYLDFSLLDPHIGTDSEEDDIVVKAEHEEEFEFNNHLPDEKKSDLIVNIGILKKGNTVTDKSRKETNKENAPDCKNCANCLDMKKYGGSHIRNHPCQRRPKCNTVNSEELRQKMKKDAEIVKDIDIEFLYNEDSKTYMCKECDFSTTIKRSIRRHMKKIHPDKKYMYNEDSKKFMCKECDFSTSVESSIRRHMKNIHSDSETPKACEICGKLFKHKDSLGSHMSIYHSVPEGYTKCESCKENVPIAEFPSHTCQEFVCPVCDKAFKTFQMLKNHKRHVHMKSKELSHYCSDCGLGFAGISSLKRHMIIHQDTTPCHLCGKKVRCLKKHIEIMHTKDELRTVQCPECGKGFTGKAPLDKHRMSVHLKLRPYKCRYGCDFAYNDYSNRNAHEKKTHGKVFMTAKEEREKGYKNLKMQNESQ